MKLNNAARRDDSVKHFFSTRLRTAWKHRKRGASSHPRSECRKRGFRKPCQTDETPRSEAFCGRCRESHRRGFPRTSSPAPFFCGRPAVCDARRPGRDRRAVVCRVVGCFRIRFFARNACWFCNGFFFAAIDFSGSTTPLRSSPHDARCLYRREAIGRRRSFLFEEIAFVLFSFCVTIRKRKSRKLNWNFHFWRVWWIYIWNLNRFRQFFFRPSYTELWNSGICLFSQLLF